MPFYQDLNQDFIKAYQALEKTFRDTAYQSFSEYIAAMENVTWFEKRKSERFDTELTAFKEARLTYRRLVTTRDLTKPLATEDGIDLLLDLKRRILASCDPLTQLNSESRTANNPDAEKARPIESTAGELSSRPTFIKEGAKKKALKATALLALTLAVILKIRKGFIR